jgi:hypothetical protein
MNFRDQITAPVVPFLTASGISRTRFYELLAAGEIKSVTVGKKRLVIIQSYLDFLDRQTHAPPIPSPNPRAAPRASKAPTEEVDQPRRRRDRRISKEIEAQSRKLTDSAVRREARKLGMVMPRRRGSAPGEQKSRERRDARHASGATTVSSAHRPACEIPRPAE